MIDKVIEGINNADRGADPDWKERAFGAALRVCVTKDEFTADDVWEELGETPTTATTPTSAAMGPVMLRLKRAGIARATGRFLSPGERRTSENGHQYIQVWEVLA